MGVGLKKQMCVFGWDPLAPWHALVEEFHVPYLILCTISLSKSHKRSGKAD